MNTLMKLETETTATELGDTERLVMNVCPRKQEFGLSTHFRIQ